MHGNIHTVIRQALLEGLTVDQILDKVKSLAPRLATDPDVRRVIVWHQRRVAYVNAARN